MAHLLVRRTLSRLAAVDAAAWTFAVSASGRPEIEAPSTAGRLRFSLSRASDLAACAVCLDHAVGIDVEVVDESRMPENVVQRILSADEREALSSYSGAARLRRLFALWTLKEACLKAQGVGLVVDPAALSFSLPPSGAPTVRFAASLEQDAGAWRLVSGSLPPGHAFAVAVRCPAGCDLRCLPPREDRNVLAP